MPGLAFAVPHQLASQMACFLVGRACVREVGSIEIADDGARRVQVKKEDGHGHLPPKVLSGKALVRQKVPKSRRTRPVRTAQDPVPTDAGITFAETARRAPADYARSRGTGRRRRFPLQEA